MKNPGRGVRKSKAHSNRYSDDFNECLRKKQEIVVYAKVHNEKSSYRRHLEAQLMKRRSGSSRTKAFKEEREALERTSLSDIIDSNRKKLDKAPHL